MNGRRTLRLVAALAVLEPSARAPTADVPPELVQLRDAFAEAARSQTAGDTRSFDEKIESLRRQIERLEAERRQVVVTKVRPLRQRYVEKLGQLERQFTQAGDLQAALHVREERGRLEAVEDGDIDRLLAWDSAGVFDSASLEEYLVGTRWSFRYSEAGSGGVVTQFGLVFEKPGAARFEERTYPIAWEALDQRTVRLSSNGFRGPVELRFNRPIDANEGEFVPDENPVEGTKLPDQP